MENLLQLHKITDSPEVYFEFQNSLDSLCIDLTDIDLLEKTIIENSKISTQ